MRAASFSPGQRPVLCLHGFLGDSADWEPLSNALGPAYRVAAPALPGHGAPPVASFTDAVASVVDAIRASPEPPQLVGYSMGGRIALAAALQPGVRLASLVILSASPGMECAMERAERARGDDRTADLLERRGLPRFVRDWYAQPLFASLARRPALLHALQSRRAQGRAADRASALRALSVGRQPSLWPCLGSLRHRTLFIAGELDAAYRDALARASGLCPRARLLIVPDSGHMPHLEHPAFVHAHLRHFFEATEE
ncbi:MAG TPA: alpha/beta fold hydrolase [Kiritimatiellia bacterium]|nr:alpha/beta fold hydrolase [Kiritimatiellia bacterium]